MKRRDVESGLSQGSPRGLHTGELFWAPWQVISGKSFKVTDRRLPLQNPELSLVFLGASSKAVLELRVGLAFRMDGKAVTCPLSRLAPPSAREAAGGASGELS